MKFGDLLKEKGYTWAHDIRRDIYNHIDDNTNLSLQRSQLTDADGFSEIEYSFKVLKDHGVIIPIYKKTTEDKITRLISLSKVTTMLKVFDHQISSFAALSENEDVVESGLNFDLDKIIEKKQEERKTLYAKVQKAYDKEILWNETPSTFHKIDLVRVKLNMQIETLHELLIANYSEYVKDEMKILMAEKETTRDKIIYDLDVLSHTIMVELE